MTGLFARVGVDYLQWKAVSRTLLRADFRAPTGASTRTLSLRTAAGLLSMAAVFGIFGVASAIVVVLNPDARLTATITLTYLAFALSTTLLTQHGATLLSPSDYAILGSRPVAARTFLAIRLTNVVFHALVLTTFVAYPPVVAFTLAHGTSVARGLAAAAAIYAWAMTVTFAVVAAYASLLRLVGAARLRRVVAYSQVAAGIAAYAGFFLAMEAFGRRAVARATLPDALAFALPPAWFASYVEIANGTAGAGAWLRAALSIALAMAIAATCGGRLAEGFTARMGEAEAATPTRRRSGSGLLRFARDETRAVLILTLGHVRHDLRIRMGLFGVVPLLLIYVVRGLGNRGNPDPFLGAARDSGLDMVALAALMFPAIVLRQLESSDAYRAAWIFGVTPADRGRLAVALKNIAAAGFLAPFALLIAALFAWRFGNLAHALAHAALLAGVGLLALQCAVLVRPQLPFAQPPQKSGGTATVIWLIGVMIGGQLLLVAAQRFVYPSWPRLGACLAIIAVASCLLEAIVRRRARRWAQDWR